MKKLSHRMKENWLDFLSLIYPNLCASCENVLVKQELAVCTKCLVDLPRTYYHLVKDNPVEQIFWGRVPIEKATAFFTYQKGSKYQHVLHELKYKGNRSIGVEMGKHFGADLIQNNYFGEADVIVPVPLHPKKEKQRGYNQSLAIAEGLSLLLNKEVVMNNLFRKSYSTTQTLKGRFERWQNVSSLFDLKDAYAFDNKHVLLVDDIVTTGATLEACAMVLHKAQNVKISIATLGYSNQ